MPSASSRTDAHQLVTGDDADQANQGGRSDAADAGKGREIIAALDPDEHLVTQLMCHYRNRRRLASVLAFKDLHRRCRGANQKCRSFKGTRKLWRQGHRSGARLFPLRLPGGKRLSEFILEVGTPFLELSLKNPRGSRTRAGLHMLPNPERRHDKQSE